MDYSLAQLRGFVAIAEELHFGRAAERLRMTQPPLTRQLQTLERILGVRLLDRERGVRLTPAGAAFLTDARQVLTLVDAAPETARRVAAGDVGTLRLGFTAIGAYAVLGPMLTLINERLPQVEVDLTEQVSEEQFAVLATNRLDLGLVRAPIPDGLASRRVHTEELVLAVPADDPRATSPAPLRMRDVSADYIGYSPEGSQDLHRACAALIGIQDFLGATPGADRDAARPRSQAKIATQFPTMLALVRAGRGFALIPRSCTAMRIDGVVYRDLAAADAQAVQLHACWNPESADPVLARVLPLLFEDCFNRQQSAGDRIPHAS